jgi:hypothetical protein
VRLDPEFAKRDEVKQLRLKLKKRGGAFLA